jgi:small subunit ribosomal protein S17
MITKKGVVVKRSGDKTIKVEVVEYRADPKYKKQRRLTKNYLVHDEANKAQDGDSVQIQQVRPISKQKHWVLVTLNNQEQK